MKLKKEIFAVFLGIVVAYVFQLIFLITSYALLRNFELKLDYFIPSISVQIPLAPLTTWFTFGIIHVSWYKTWIIISVFMAAFVITYFLLTVFTPPLYWGQFRLLKTTASLFIALLCVRFYDLEHDLPKK